MKNIKDNIVKEEVIVNGELMVYNTDLAAINEKVDKAIKIDEIVEDIHLLKRIEGEMDFAEKEFKEKVKESLEGFNKKKKALSDTLDKIKAKAITEAQDTLIIKTKIVKDGFDDETGEVKFKKKRTTEYTLPAGLTYKNGSTSYDYKEEGLAEKFFKKTIKKTEVKKAIASGELDGGIAIPKRGAPSISIDTLKLGAYIEARQADREEE